MIKIIALVIYILSGELKIEQKQYDSKVECILQAGKRMTEVEKLPGYEEGVYAACIEAKVVKA